MKLKSVLSALGMAALTWQASAAPSVEINNVQQQYPWTNVVDIAYTVSGITNAEYFAVFEAKEIVNGKEVLLGAVTNELDGTGKKASDQITLATTWEPDFNWQKTGVTMTPYIYRGGVGAGDDYLIIDLETWKVTYEGMVTQEDSNKKYNTDEYKTKKMVFRKVPGQKYTIGGSTTYLGSTWYGIKNRYNHSVNFPTNYYIAIFRLTEGQYARMTGNSNATTRNKKTIQLQTWNTMRGSAGIAAKVSTGPLYTMQSKTGLKIDLPTHAMYAVGVSAGTTALWADGTGNAAPSAASTKYIWCSNNSGNSYAHDVGSLLPNAWGLYDTAGLYGTFVRDCPSSTTESDGGTTFVDNSETALANNFMPISTGTTSNRIFIGGVNAYSAPYNDAQNCYNYLYREVPNAERSYRLAVYPAKYYPNGGK